MRVEKLFVYHMRINQRQYDNADNNTVVAEQLEPVFLQVPDKETDGQHGNDKRYDTANDKGHSVIGVEQLCEVFLTQRVVQVYFHGFGILRTDMVHLEVVGLAGVNKAFYAGGKHGGHGEEERKFCGRLPVQLLAQPADN